MDLTWIIIIIGTIFIAGYILYTASEKRIEALGKKSQTCRKIAQTNNTGHRFSRKGR
ncbi:hypothetical protein [Planococcus antarcticus]|uniref:hypothetical protein n=1 Tax=Planococcus antarcticus TaxID=161360 RepID=UPI0012B60764|nr:hypothetical protein [Planococcus antarcticus]